MMSLDDIRAALDRARVIKIMILDACRNNPVADSFRRRVSGGTRNVDATRGLARVERMQSMVVAYSTAADAVAADGTGRNSPYTGALLKRLGEAGLEIEIMFRRVAADVSVQTNGRQRPETSISLVREYYLNQKDREAWERIKDSGDAAQIRDFLGRFPSSAVAPDANLRLHSLERAAREKLENEAGQREAARLRQEEEQRLRVAGLERERVERETALRRQEAERKVEAERQQKAEAERQRVEREAALRRQDADRKLETERQQKAEVERQRLEREAALRRQDAERKVEAERQQKAEAERQRLEREAVLRRQDAERKVEAERQQKAEADRQRLEREAALKVVPNPLSQDQACKDATEKLAQLRVSRSRDEVVQFERELACERLRPQVARLRESLAIVEQPTTTTRTEGTEFAAVNPPRDREATVQPAPASRTQDQACKDEAEILARLRVSRSRDEVFRFERELVCERLRPQAARLRESFPNEEPSERGQPDAGRVQTAAGERGAPDAVAAGQREAEQRRADAERQRREREAALQSAPARRTPEQACKEDAERLGRLRVSRSRDEVIRFERELTCERLRPQVTRLRESVGIQ